MKVRTIILESPSSAATALLVSLALILLAGGAIQELLNRLSAEKREQYTSVQEMVVCPNGMLYYQERLQRAATPEELPNPASDAILGVKCFEKPLLFGPKTSVKSGQTTEIDCGVLLRGCPQ